MDSLIVVINALPAIAAGGVVTVGTVAVSLALGFVLGTPLAVCQVYGCAAARRLAEIYVWFFRGVPILVLLFLFYGLFIALNLPAAPFLICSVTLGMTSTAYQSQIYRGAIQSLPKGQLNAARALGMGDKTAVACIILPQALRLSIPGFANEFSILLKDSAICFVLGAQDIMARAGFVAARTHEHLALYAAAGLLYFALTHIVVKLLLRLERHFRIPDYAVEGGGRS